LLLCCCCSCVCCGSVCLCAFAFVAELSLTSCRRCRRAACCSFAVLSSAVAVERFRSFGGLSHFAPVLLRFLWMMWIGLSLSFRCRRRTVVAVVVPLLSSCGRRCRSCAALSLYSPRLSLSNAFVALENTVTLLLCCCCSCGCCGSVCL
jgi:hypothetical protein